VYKVNTDGTGFGLLKHFAPASYDGTVYDSTNSDGYNSLGNLLLSGSTLYGTTAAGSSSGNGTVFKINTNGSGFALLKQFPAYYYDYISGAYTNSDGAKPYAGLAISGGTLFGTTYRGGNTGQGTIFKVNTDGSGFAVLKHFAAYAYDSSSGQYTNSEGVRPQTGLTISGSTLYGVTAYGGSAGYGTVFKLNMDGTGFTVLRHLASNEGANSYGTLQLSGSTLYGTANGGSLGGGTVFKINTDGTGFAVLQPFLPASYPASWGYAYTNSGGARLHGGVVLSDGKLFGTTLFGGDYGWGVLFGLTDVTGLPVITTHPASQTVPALGTANFSVVATGDAPLAFQWLFNNSAIADATNVSLSIPNVVNANVGNYSVIAYNNLGSAVSLPASLAIGSQPPVIFSTNSSIGFSNGQFGFSFSGPSGSSVAIEASTNLQTWVRLQTNLLGGASVYFSDPASSSLTTRFYRAVLLP